MCPYDKVRGAKMVLSVMMVFAIVITLCSCSGASREQSGTVNSVADSAASDSNDQTVNAVNEGDPSSDLTIINLRPSANAVTMFDDATANANNSSDGVSSILEPELPLVTNYSFGD